MCGIIARVGTDEAIPALLSGLQNLEYRGYDSAGVAVLNGSGIQVRKRSGEVADLVERIDPDPPAGNLGIGHTRWSTHGPPVDRNAHPHTCTTGDIAVVHNGVIENHGELRDRLVEAGHAFDSDTDTEVIPHLFQTHLDDHDEPAEAFRRTVADLDGSYAVAAIVDGVDAVFGARKQSPLVIGVDDDAYFLASDVPAFLDQTHRVVYLKDDDVAELRPNGMRVTDADGKPVDREVEQIDWDPDEIERGAFDHYMAKEIHSQPAALADTIQGRIVRDTAEVALDDMETGGLEDTTSVQLVGCGTSYHAAMVGSRLFRRLNLPAQAVLASEYEDAAEPVDPSTLTVAVTQSGETADTLDAVRRAGEAGARTLAVTNVMGSTVTREADDTLFIRAGPEIGVAATKTFSSQVVTLAMLAQRVASVARAGQPNRTITSSVEALPALPSMVDRVLTQTNARAVAQNHLDSDAFFYIGRGLACPVALEGALKFKEITYEHAEGFAAGELKHGPLALVTPRTPVVAIFNGDRDEKSLTNAKEVQTRGARIIAVAPDGHPAVDIADDHLWIPEAEPVQSSILANVQLQLFAYHAATLLGRSIDKPRNLAKSVTVD